MTNKTRQSANDEEPDDWTFIWVFALMLGVGCAVPTGIFVLGAWLVKLIWGG